MRLLLDQNLSRDLPALLAGPTFDVADTRSLGMQRWDDEAITDYAAAEDRVIVSADTDFGAILAARQSAKPSFVLLRRTNNLSPEAIAAVLASNLPAHEEALSQGAIVVISDNVVRVRQLPITPP